MSKNNSACADSCESLAVGNNACSNSRSSIVSCAACNNSSCLETCKLGSFFGYLARYLAGLVNLCQHGHINTQLVADLLAPAAVRNIKKLHSRCV